MHVRGTACWSLAGSFAAQVSSDGAWQAMETSSPLGTGPRRAWLTVVLRCFLPGFLTLTLGKLCSVMSYSIAQVFKSFKKHIDKYPKWLG